MKIVAVSGTYRKGRTIDTLIDKVIEGASQSGEVHVERIQLIDRKIEYCRNCMACKESPPEDNLARCVIDDDMQEILPLMDEADAYVLGTPVNIGDATAVMKAFLERLVWVMSKPGEDTFPVRGIPVPRNPRKRTAVYVISAGGVPSILRSFCDNATPLFDSMCQSSFNARVVGNLYAGAVDKKGMECYFRDAEYMGKKMAKITRRLIQQREGR